MAWLTIPVDDAAALEQATALLRGGGVVVVPTDTVYGVATLTGGEDTLAALKHRPASMPIAVLVANVEQAAVAAGRDLPESALRLAEQFWPGPLTLVVPTADGGTVGVRCPDHTFVRRLAAAVGPIATTSANRHGEPTPATAEAAAQSLAAPGPSLVIDGGAGGSVASTVVDVTGDRPVVRREGVIGADELGLPG